MAGSSSFVKPGPRLRWGAASSSSQAAALVLTARGAVLALAGCTRAGKRAPNMALCDAATAHCMAASLRVAASSHSSALKRMHTPDDETCGECAEYSIVKVACMRLATCSKRLPDKATRRHQRVIASIPPRVSLACATVRSACRQRMDHVARAMDRGVSTHPVEMHLSSPLHTDATCDA